MNKEIEEMARDICTACKTRHNCDKELCCMCEVVAKELVKKYRKLPEDSVVLTREEYESDLTDQYDIGYEQGSKETAEKILERGKYNMPEWLKDWIVEQFGVDIKE